MIIHLLFYKFGHENPKDPKFSGSYRTISRLINYIYGIEYQHVKLGFETNDVLRGDYFVVYDIAVNLPKMTKKFTKDLKTCNADEQIKIKVPSMKDFFEMKSWLERELERGTGYNYAAYCWNFTPILKCLPIRGSGLLCTQMVSECLLAGKVFEDQEESKRALKHAYKMKVGELRDLVSSVAESNTSRV